METARRRVLCVVFICLWRAQIRNQHGQIIGREETEVAEIEISETQELMSVGKIVNKAG